MHDRSAVSIMAIETLNAIDSAFSKLPSEWKSKVPWTVVLASAGIWLSLLFYRLFLHPLACVPGPVVARLTSWWEVYENVWKGGHLPFELRKLHQVYGPIIRIAPNSVQIASPSVHEKIYHVGSQFGKDEWYYQVAFGPRTFFTANAGAVHRAGREPLSHFFSKRNVVENLQHAVTAECEKLHHRIREFTAEGGKEKAGKPIPIHDAFRCVSGDVVTEVAWGWDEKTIEQEDFAAKFHHNLATVQRAMWKRLYFPRVTKLLNLTPPHLVKMMDEAVGNFLGVMEICRNQVIRIKAETESPEYKVSGNHKTIFHALLDADTRVRGKDAMKHDLETMTGIGALVYTAAIETTSNAMTTITYHTLRHPSVLAKLQKELDTAFPSPLPETPVSFPLKSLESLPYLTACIYEGLRLSFGVASRLPRIVPPGQPLIVEGKNGKKFALPPGTQVGMSAYDMHLDESIWGEDVFTFKPERWLGRERQLEKYLVSFSKGSRQCLGMNLAWCEIYIFISMLFRRFDMEIFETSDEDMEIKADFFNAWTGDGTREFHITAKMR